MSSKGAMFTLRQAFCAMSFVVAVLLHLATPLRADSVVMKSGKTIDGNITSGSNISVFVKDVNGLLQPVMLADVAEIRVDLESGEEIVGRLVSFSNGTHEVLTDGWMLFIRDGKVVQSVALNDQLPQGAILQDAGGPGLGAVEVEPEAAPEPKSVPGGPLNRRATM
jgi:hypothetical protein